MADENVAGVNPAPVQGNSFVEHNNTPDESTASLAESDKTTGVVNRNQSSDEVLEAARAILEKTQGEDTPVGQEPAPEQLKEEPKKEPESKEADDHKLTAEDINTGDEVLDTAIEMFISTTDCTEADITRALDNAMKYNNPELIDKAFLQERFGEKAGQAERIAKAFLKTVAKQQETLTSSVYELAGSKEVWTTAAGIFNKNAPVGVRNSIKAAIDSGDAESIKWAANEVLKFANNSGAVVKQGVKLSGSGNVAMQGLSSSEFKEQLSKLNPHSRTYAQDMIALQNLRVIGHRAGRD